MSYEPTHEDVRRIRNRANDLRTELLLDSYQRLPVIEFLEFEFAKLKQYADFRLVVGANDRFPEGVLAFAKGSPLQIVICEKIYCGAVRGDTPSRHTLLHEVGHIVMHVFLPHKNFASRDNITDKLEWEADEFASELLLPSSTIWNMVSSKKMVSSEIASYFDVSEDFARQRLRVIENRAQKKEKPLEENTMANSQLTRFINREFAPLILQM